MTVDLHSHILPGIDDGAADAGMSEKMIEAEKKLGITKIVFTPHFYMSEKTISRFISDRDAAFGKISDVLARLGTQVRCGAEVLYTKSLADADLSGLCISGTRYMLIELPYQYLTASFINEFKSFIGGLYPDISPILAHAERYLNFTDEKSLYEILDCDMLVQLNAGSFSAFSKHKRFIFGLLENNAAHLLGTDCHNITSRPPNMDIAVKAIRRRLGDGCCKKLNDNAERIFAGEVIL